MVGFGESIASLVHQDSVWISRVIAVGILVLLLGNYMFVFIFVKVTNMTLTNILCVAVKYEYCILQ